MMRFFRWLFRRPPQDKFGGPLPDTWKPDGYTVRNHNRHMKEIR